MDNIELKFEPDAIERIAEISVDLNATSEDIGARRLHTVMEYLLEDVSFNAGGMDVPGAYPRSDHGRVRGRAFIEADGQPRFEKIRAVTKNGRRNSRARTRRRGERR